MDQSQQQPQTNQGHIEETRIKLNALLKEVMAAAGKDQNVYFQPPETLKMSYPCIVYNRRSLDKISADNTKYLTNRRYQLTYIDRQPNSNVLDYLMDLPYCRHTSHYISDNLNHDTFEIYY